MTARDTIAAAHHAEISRRSGELPAWRDLPQSVRDYYLSSADAVIAAVRSMPVEDQAELIGGGIETSAWKHWPGGGTRRRVRGPWVER